MATLHPSRLAVKRAAQLTSAMLINKEGVSAMFAQGYLTADMVRATLHRHLIEYTDHTSCISIRTVVSHMKFLFVEHSVPQFSGFYEVTQE